MRGPDAAAAPDSDRVTSGPRTTTHDQRYDEPGVSYVPRRNERRSSQARTRDLRVNCAIATHREQLITLQYWSTNEPGLITVFAERFNMPEQSSMAAIPASSRVLPHLVTSTFCASE